MRHFFLRDEAGFPLACVASERLDEHSIRFAVAVFNPEDTFERKVAVTTAKRRAANPSKSITIPIASPMKHNIIRLLTTDKVLWKANKPLKGKRHKPGGQWWFVSKAVQEAAKLWLDKHPLRPIVDGFGMRLVDESSEPQDPAVDLSSPYASEIITQSDLPPDAGHTVCVHGNTEPLTCDECKLDRILNEEHHP